MRGNLRRGSRRCRPCRAMLFEFGYLRGRSVVMVDKDMYMLIALSDGRSRESLPWGSAGRSRGCNWLWFVRRWYSAVVEGDRVAA